MRQRRTARTANPEPIVQQLPCEFQTLLAYVTGPGAGWQRVDTGEFTRFRRRRALGAALWRRVCGTRAAVRRAEGPKRTQKQDAVGTSL
jgi:hypothetical protein